jgi:hypothetical protein
MKALILAASLLMPSCVSTVSGYQTPREFPAEPSLLDVEINYSNEMAEGSAWATTILGFINLRPTSYASSAQNSWFGSSNSVENAAVYNILSTTNNDVLGFPLVTKKVTNYFLWKTEEASVKGFPGKVVRAQNKR